VEALRAEGLQVELELLTGVPHDEVQQAIARCDLLVDQVFSDLPWSALAAEAAAQGRPTLIAGYAGAWYEQWGPQVLPPSRFVLPGELTDALRELVVESQARQELGAAALLYAQEHRRPEQVAAVFASILSGREPPGWRKDPATAPYVFGCGAPVTNVQQVVRALVRTHGRAALGLNDKPAYGAEVDMLLEADLREWGP
jgi:hypothetical protein